MAPRIRWLWVGISLAFPRAALASDSFPQALREAWGVSDLGVPAQGCLLCHMTDPGVLGNVQKPFGLTVKKYEVPVKNPAALKTALGRIRAAGTDSDGDGIPDYDELLGGTNVNVANAMQPDVPDPDPEPDPPGPEAPDDGSAGNGSPPSPAGGSPNVSFGGGRSFVVHGPTQPEPQAPPIPETGCAVSARSTDAPRAWTLALALFAWVARRRSRRGK